MIVFMANGPTAGKTTAAGLMSSILAQYKPALVPFAKPVKDLATQMGWDGLKDARGRTLLEDIGMGGRRYYPDIWVDLWGERVLQLWGNSRDRLIFADDCRFPNEFKRVQRFGGVLIKIKKEGKERPDLRAEQWVPEDSEFDYVVENNGTLSELNDKLISIAKDLLDE